MLDFLAASSIHFSSHLDLLLFALFGIDTLCLSFILNIFRAWFLWHQAFLHLLLPSGHLFSLYCLYSLKYWCFSYSLWENSISLKIILSVLVVFYLEPIFLLWDIQCIHLCVGLLYLNVLVQSYAHHFLCPLLPTSLPLPYSSSWGKCYHPGAQATNLGIIDSLLTNNYWLC